MYYNITGDIMKTLNITIDHLTKEGVGVTRIEKKPMYIMYAIDGEEILANVENDILKLSETVAGIEDSIQEALEVLKNNRNELK